MTPTTTLCSTLVKHGFTCTATLSSPGQITNTGTVKGKDPIGLEVTATDTAVVSVLEIVVLPAVVNQPTALLPAPAPAPQPTLPVTGADLLRWTTAGLALIPVAGQTRPGDVYVTAAARRVLCPNLPDSDQRPSPG